MVKVNTVANFITDFHKTKYLQIGVRMGGNREWYISFSQTSLMELFEEIINDFGKHCAGVPSLIR